MQTALLSFMKFYILAYIYASTLVQIFKQSTSHVCLTQRYMSAALAVMHWPYQGH